MKKLPDKILTLRKKHQMSQEELAERLSVSRQAVSRWESGTALPDTYNLLQLSRIFDVTADYLLDDNYRSDRDLPAVKKEEHRANRTIQKVVGLCISAAGLLGNFVIYLLSRWVEVMVPHITYDSSGTKWYRWSGNLKGISYRYFIEAYNLEFLTIMFWLLMFVGILIFLRKPEGVSQLFSRWKMHPPLKRSEKKNGNAD